MYSHLKPYCAFFCLLILTTVTISAVSAQSDYKSLTGKSSDTAGPFGNLNEAARYFAILKSVDAEQEKVVLLIEGETEPREWSLSPGAELWCNGWWCRLKHFQTGDRVWVWFEMDRDFKPVRVALLVDEFSEQDLYAPFQIKAVDATDTDAAITLESQRGNEPTKRSIKLAGTEVYRADSLSTLDSLHVGETVYVQTTGDHARLILDSAAFEARRAAQQVALREIWLNEGLPATVIFVHPDLKQVEVMLDHEALVWGRSLDPGQLVALQASEFLKVAVERLRPWRERTQVLLTIHGDAFPTLMEGQRVRIGLPVAPSNENHEIPVGLDKPRSKADRVEWIMSSIYCTCLMNDVCAGHVYTLAGCDAGPGHTCGLAHSTREDIASAIDQGQSDREIFNKLLKERGAKLLRPHMLP